MVEDRDFGDELTDVLFTISVGDSKRRSDQIAEQILDRLKRDHGIALRKTDGDGRTEMEQRWNKAATAAGYVGSEWIDDPEFVFKAVRKERDQLFAAQKELARLRKENR